MQKRRTAMSGWHFIDWLEKQGILTEGRKVRRVIIDASIDDAVLIYVEELCSTMLDDEMPEPMILRIQQDFDQLDQEQQEQAQNKMLWLPARDKDTEEPEEEQRDG